MASTSSWTLKIETSVTAPRLFRVAIMDWHNLAPKLIPEVIASTHGVQGEGAISSIRQFNFTSVMSFSFTKEWLDLLDVNKCECKTSLIEGTDIGTVVESVMSHMNVEPATNSGSIVKVVSTYKLLPGVEEKGKANKAKETVTTIFKTAEAYLITNLDAYN